MILSPLNLTASAFPGECPGMSERIQMSFSLQIEDSPPRAAGELQSDSVRIPRGLPRDLPRALTRGKRAHSPVLARANKRTGMSFSRQIDDPMPRVAGAIQSDRKLIPRV